MERLFFTKRMASSSYVSKRGFTHFLLPTGSKMTLPCKVFVGLSGHVHTDVEWLANDTTIDVIYKQSRVTEGERQ